jgi:hypothetical protein
LKTLLSITALVLVLPGSQNPPQPQRPAPPAPLTAAECRCSIEITVKRHGSGAPLGEVGVVATYSPPAVPSPDGVFRPGTPSPVTLNATTDDSGHAIFSNLAEGSYSIRAQREGFFGSVTGAFPSPQALASVSVGPAPANRDSRINSLQVNAASRGGIDAANIVPQPVQHVTIEMFPGGVISGRIQDANHRPAAGIAVIPFQVRYQYGRRTLQQTSTQVQTDDLGQFRLFWFVPGEYYIRTMIPPAQAARGGGPNFPSPTYFPGTLDAARATPIVIHEGEEYNSADFELQTAKGIRISGTVTNTLPPPVVARGTATRAINSYFLVPRSTGMTEPPIVITNPVNAGGGRGVTPDTTTFPFEFRGVPAGTYDFYPIFNATGSGFGNRGSAVTGHLVIEAGSENVSGVQAVIQPGVDLKVHVSIVGTPQAGAANRVVQPPKLSSIRIQFRPVDNLPSQLIQGITQPPLPDDDGNFTLTNLPEARFFAASIYQPFDGYVSEMRQGNRSIMDDATFTIGKDTPDSLEIVINRNGGTVSGTVQDSQRRPLQGRQVFLIPDAPRHRNLLLYKIAGSNGKGEFNLYGVAPGSYKLFAWENIPQGAEQNEEFLSRYAVLGTRVNVNAGTPMTNIQVLSIP